MTEVPVGPDPGGWTSGRVVLVAALALVAGAVSAMLVLDSDHQPTPTWASAALALLVGWAYIGSGLVAWRHRPDNRLGSVMVFIGFAWFATFLADAHNALLFTLGTALENVYLLGFVYLVLSFPTGTLHGRMERALVAAAVVLTIVVELGWLLLADSDAVICSGCPENLLQVAREDTVADGLLQLQRIAGLVFSLFTAVLLVERWRQASPPQRRAAAPVMWTGGAMFAALAISIANDIAGEPLSPVPTWVRSCVFAAIPVSVLAVLLRRRLARGAVAGLVVELGTGATPLDLRDALARALGDPSLEIAYWLPAQQRYVDADGRSIEPPHADPQRAATTIERDGQPVAVLIHDSALRDDADLVESVCAAAALTLENERLRAELLARLAELQASRARLAEATEAERRRIERDLHDGAQQRLVAIAMALSLAESKLTGDRPTVEPVLREARDSLALALQELREISHGIRPAILVERGLGVSLDDLSRRAMLPVRVELALRGRLPQEIEAAAYFAASEALTNAAKHSHANQVHLRVSDEGSTLVLEIADDGIGGAALSHGSGLRGLTDRVEALGGRLTVSSPPGRGTTLRAEIPCE